jgi:threonine dehydrogenase-like Zn-dependent dehydrogenase
MSTAFAVARPGSMIGFVGVPHGVEVPIDTMFGRNIGLRGGSAPVRRYIPKLLDDVLQERIHPGLVFDFETNLDGVAEAYRRMDERRAIKSLLRIGTA